MLRKNRLMILVVLIALTMIGVNIMNIFDKRPFRFEDFKIADALKTFLEQKYPIGSDGNIAMKDLELAGAKCHIVVDRSKLPNPNDLKEYDYIGWCDYSSGWLSWPPLRQYQILVLGDEKRNIIEFFVSKYSGFTI